MPPVIPSRMRAIASLCPHRDTAEAAYPFAS